MVNGLVPAQFTSAEDNQTYDLSGQAGPLLEILQILEANNIPLNRMVDVRSNPILRQHIQAVVAARRPSKRKRRRLQWARPQPRPRRASCHRSGPSPSGCRN